MDKNKLDIIEIFFDLKSKDNEFNNELFQLNYFYLLFYENLIINWIKEKCYKEYFSVFISIWCKLLIQINFEDNDDEQNLDEKFLNVSRNIFQNFIMNDFIDANHPGSSTDNYDKNDASQIPLITFERILSKFAAEFQSNLDGQIEQINLVDQCFRKMINVCKQTISKHKWNFSNSSDVNLMCKLYFNVSLLIFYLPKQLYISGNSDCLMVVILENIIILPSNILSVRTVWPTIFNKSFSLVNFFLNFKHSLLFRFLDTKRFMEIGPSK